MLLEKEELLKKINNNKIFLNLLSNEFSFLNSKDIFFINQNVDKNLDEIYCYLSNDNNINTFNDYHEIIKKGILSFEKTDVFLRKFIFLEFFTKNMRIQQQLNICKLDYNFNFSFYYLQYFKKYLKSLEKIKNIINFFKKIKTKINKVDLINLLSKYSLLTPLYMTINYNNLKFDENEKSDYIIDFIITTVQKKYISDNLILNMRNLLDNENKKINKTLLTYLNPYIISEFTNIFFNHINKIMKQESIKIKDSNENTYIHKDKKNFFHCCYIDFFLMLSPKIALESYKHTGYLNLKLTKEIVKHISLNKEISSHYVQAAYLEHIIGKECFIKYDNLLGYKFNVKNTKYINPYCIPYFYGTSKEKESIEKRLNIIEKDYIYYLEDLQKRKTKTVTLIDKLKFLLNYIRTSSFLYDLEKNYVKFQENYINNYTKKLNQTKLIKHIHNIIPYHNRKEKFKNIQYELIHILLDILEGKKRYFFAKQKNDNFFSNFLNFIFNFINQDLYIDIIDVDINEFSSNFFILKKKSEYCFIDELNIDYAYFPIEKNKIIVFKKTEKQVISFDENCMIDLSYIPFIVSRENND